MMRPRTDLWQARDIESPLIKPLSQFGNNQKVEIWYTEGGNSGEAHEAAGYFQWDIGMANRRPSLFVYLAEYEANASGIAIKVSQTASDETKRNAERLARFLLTVPWAIRKPWKPFSAPNLLDPSKPSLVWSEPGPLLRGPQIDKLFRNEHREALDKDVIVVEFCPLPETQKSNAIQARLFALLCHGR